MALELPEVARLALAAWGSRVAGTIPGLRAPPAGGLHLTLCFLGRRGVEEIGPIATACDVVTGCDAPTLSVADSVWLPSRRPRVLAVRLVDRDGEAARLQRRLAGTLDAGGWYRPEPRPFLAHVSVARVGRGARAGRRRVASPPGLTLTPSTVTLYRSRLRAEGARYEPLHSVPLGRPA